MARRKSLLAQVYAEHKRAKLERERLEEQARKAWAAEARKVAAQEAKEAAQRRREAERAEQARLRAAEQATRQLAADQRERERQAAAQMREQQRQEAEAPPTGCGAADGRSRSYDRGCASEGRRVRPATA
jgi:hypothetical protein